MNVTGRCTMKKLISLTLALLLIISAFAFPSGAISTEKVSVMVFKSKNLTFEKAESDIYNCKVTNNDEGFISVSANNEGGFYWLMVKGKKATTDTIKPVITVSQKKDGKTVTVKKFRITVKPAETVKMSDVKINKDTSTVLHLKNPYETEYKFSLSKKIVSIKQRLFNGNDAAYTLKGLKNGTTTVKAYIKGTKTLIGSFKITVGDFKPVIKKSFQSLTVCFNEHMKETEFLPGGVIELGEAVRYFHSGGKITAKAKDKTIVDIKTSPATDVTPKAVKLIGKTAGKTIVTLYETVGKTKTKIGTIKLTVKRAKDSKVYEGNRELDNDGIFYENFISPGEKYDLKKAVINKYVNFKGTKSHFDTDEYTFTAKSSHPSILSVNEKGVVTCHKIDKKGVCKISYTIVFADGSKAKGGGQFDIIEAEV